MVLKNKEDISIESQENLLPLVELRDMTHDVFVKVNQKMTNSRSDNCSSSYKQGGRAGYWIYFARRGLKADCRLGGCKHPAVSLGKEGSRRGHFALKEHLRRNHSETWAKYLKQKENTDMTLLFDNNQTI